VLAGLPEPEGNVDLGGEWFFIGRVDLYLREWNVAVEYEGDQHRSDARLFGQLDGEPVQGAEGRPAEPSGVVDVHGPERQGGRGRRFGSRPGGAIGDGAADSTTRSLGTEPSTCRV